MARLVWCRRCTAMFTSVAGELKNVCPSCKLDPAHWTTMAPEDSIEPVKPYEVTTNDRRFLRSLRIAAE
jgi:hypothetical protein